MPEFFVVFRFAMFAFIRGKIKQTNSLLYTAAPARVL